MISHRLLSILKCLLNCSNLAVSVLVDFLFCELLFDRHTNPKHKTCLGHTESNTSSLVGNFKANMFILTVETYLTSTFSLETPYLLNSVEIYSVFLIHGTTLACCWDLVKENMFRKINKQNLHMNLVPHKADYQAVLPL